jgi:hypothetical protein
MKNRPQKEISSEETNEELGQKNAQVPWWKKNWTLKSMF